MTISMKEIEQTAVLARLALSEHEEDLFLKQIGSILDEAERLQEVDTQDIPPTINILPLHNVMREDLVQPSLKKDEVFQNAANEEDGMFRVPKIV
ncbi:Asp-tRNA(Asn)/Glu-tRNA(Gln) amidotransferase subunit GatC [Dehalobacterium formicoaceticum]|uniref:Aspartyl/glutamyl-tRNA(Asn/Gln) amidotransferase subunit C n=1 Tax=Dehalobacterium formicoaceticum TaxID=51515 RepID=A0ABT1Y7R1_9FIRM|nr:Asp-tRNA(Asn)/Glu-tRNA(Gln) amidotransferase subunit GatC [Dehalobacterium formicoaceticum]MCR6546915.1 Asp-tRNA(Asn)/Glu-tRNA(Gln) amidotransferase subunit GatC [Dehalobacterium formicoaceticum]